MKSAKIQSTKKVRKKYGESPKYKKKYEKSTKYDESMKKVQQKKNETEIRDTSRADNIDHSAGTALSSIL